MIGIIWLISGVIGTILAMILSKISDDIDELKMSDYIIFTLAGPFTLLTDIVVFLLLL